MTGDAAELNCWLRMSCRHNLTSIGRQCRGRNHCIKGLGFSSALVDLAHSGMAWNGRMGAVSAA
jgi:hypothetical protein